MYFSILLILLIGLVGYWHYIQGFFSAGISAVLCIIASVFAIGYHEWIIQTLLGGKLADYAHAMVLICLFAAVYLLLRLAFDSLVPGNLRFPLLVEKIGAGAMGAIAGVFAAAVVAVAAQTLPFGPSIGGYERYPMTWDKKCFVKINESERDAVYDELKADDFLKDNFSALLLPVDQWLISLTERASNENGSLWNGKPFDDYHPDYLQELFGQRVGIQTGSKHCALEGKTEVIGLYQTDHFADQMDPESGGDGSKPTGIRPDVVKAADGSNVIRTKKMDPYQAKSGQTLVVIRTKFHRDDTDDGTNFFSFTPAGIRLCYSHKNYFPIGTLEYPAKRGQPAVIFYSNKPDDCMFTRGDAAADLVFELPESVVKSGNRFVMPNGAFIEVKRLAHVDLSSRPISSIQQASADEARNPIVQVMRKEGLPAKKDAQAPQDPNALPYEIKLPGVWQSADKAYRVEFTDNDWMEKTPKGEAHGPWRYDSTVVNQYNIKRMTEAQPLGNTINVTFNNENEMVYRNSVDGVEKTYTRVKQP